MNYPHLLSPYWGERCKGILLFLKCKQIDVKNI